MWDKYSHTRHTLGVVGAGVIVIDGIIIARCAVYVAVAYLIPGRVCTVGFRSREV